MTTPIDRPAHLPDLRIHCHPRRSEDLTDYKCVKDHFEDFVQVCASYGSEKL